MSQQVELPKLSFELHALEPVLSKELVEIHYLKHHAAYVANLNKALEQYEEAQKKNNLTQQICLQSAISFNGGGHINHSLYWENLMPISQGGGILTDGPLKDALVASFGTFEACKEKIVAKASSLQGSGWTWLGFNPERGSIEIEDTKNHELLFAKKKQIPLLCIDMWEHAYYLQYKNQKAQYLKEIWSIINWKYVEERFKKALQK